jgi:hypothetical protein
MQEMLIMGIPTVVDLEVINLSKCILIWLLI